MKIVFAGTSEFGIPTLEKIHPHTRTLFGVGVKAQHELVLVITQPDKPLGRKQIVTPPPVKVWAQKNNIPVEQPEKISNIKYQISNLAPDLLLVAAYGQIIPKEILDIPKFDSINIHGSLLPKYRGASPIQSAILNGDTETGITLIKMDEQMDHGQILAKEVVRLNGTETFTKLYSDLSFVAAELTSKTLFDWFAKRIKLAEQIHSQATFCQQFTRNDAKIEWSNTAKIIDQKIRALNPEPGTWTTLDGKSVKILSARILNESKIELPGKIYSLLGELAVKCIDASLIIDKLQPEGKNIMSGKDFLNGLKTGNKLFI